MHTMRQNAPTSPRRLISGSLSGSCLCNAVAWTLTNTLFGQVLICHCESCRKTSGSTNVPFVALPRNELWEQLQTAKTLQSYQASKMASRHFCKTCGSFVCMEYHREPSTLWVPMGTLKDFDPSLLDEEKDCHIFQQEEMPLEAALCRLHHLDGFGFYKTDVCSEKAWDDIEGWQEQSKVDDEDHNPQTIT